MNVTHEDYGLYRCVAENALGSDSKAMELFGNLIILASLSIVMTLNLISSSISTSELCLYAYARVRCASVSCVFFFGEFQKEICLATCWNSTCGFPDFFMQISFDFSSPFVPTSAWPLKNTSNQNRTGSTRAPGRQKSFLHWRYRNMITITQITTPTDQSATSSDIVSQQLFGDQP